MCVVEDMGVNPKHLVYSLLLSWWFPVWRFSLLLVWCCGVAFLMEAVRLSGVCVCVCATVGQLQLCGIW